MDTIHAPQRTSAPPDPLQLTLPPARTSLPDRIAMRIGLRLIIWSTRTRRTAADHSAHTLRHAAEQAREQRELAATRLALTAPHGA